jgi:hypothetical protein
MNTSGDQSERVSTLLKGAAIGVLLVTVVLVTLIAVLTS